MREHLDLQQFALRAADPLVADRVADAGHLVERQLAGQHRHVGPLRVETRRRGVRDVALGRNVDLDAQFACGEYGRHVRGDHGIDPLAAGPFEQRAERRHLVVVDDGIDREVGADPCVVRRAYDAGEVLFGEVGGRVGAHVERPHAEIYGVGSGLYGCGERLVAPHGSHQFYVRTFHISVCVP